MKRKAAALLLVFIFIICQNTLSAANTKDEYEECIQIVKAWNKAHNDWQFDRLRKLYGPKVLYYGKWVNKYDCINDKYSQMKPSNLYRHKIATKVKVRQLGENLMVCSFIKSVRANNTERDYPAYLVISAIDGQLKILAESDEISDKNSNFVLSESLFKEDDKVVNKLEKSKNKDSNMLLYSITSAATIAIVAFAMRRRRKRLIIEKNTAAADAPVDVTTNPNEIKPSPEELNAAPTIANPAETQAELNFKKGVEFEKYVVRKFPKGYFEIEFWQSDKYTNGRYPRSNMNPDLTMRFTCDGKSILFAVECKYRSAFFNQQIEIATEEQLARYRAFAKEKEMDVYIALGIGGAPDNPRQVHLIPISDINSNIISVDKVNKLRDKVNSDFFYNRDLKLLT